MKKLPILQTVFGILIFAQVESGLAQGAFPPGTTLPPRGYVLPPPPNYRPPAARARVVEEDRPAAKPTTAKSTKSTASTATKKKTPEVAKSTSKTPEKKSSSVAKTTKSDPKKSSVAKADTTKKSTDKPVVATSTTATKRKESIPEPKLVAANKSSVGSTKSIEKPANVDLGESPRDLHAPAGSLAARNPAVQTYQPADDRKLTSAGYQSLAPAHETAPPVLTEASLGQPNLPKLNRVERVNSGVVTSSAQLPNAVLGSAAMMPLRFSDAPSQRPDSPEESTPAEPKSIAAADLAAGQTKLDVLAALAPRAAIVEPLPMVEFPPDANFEPSEAPEIGGAPVVAKSEKTEKSEPEPDPAELPLPSHEAEPSKLLSTPTLESPSLALAPPPPRPSAPVKPTLAAVKTASFRPADAPAESSAESVDFPAEAKFSAPDTPPPPVAPKPTVKISPGLGALSIDAERADSETAKNRVTFNGNVSMNCTRFTLKADKVIADMQGDDGSGSGVQKVVSEGHVVVNMNAPDGVGAGYIASGNRAIYDPEQETLLISGWPKIEEGNKALVASSAATEILIDTKTGRLTTTGSTKTMIK